MFQVVAGALVVAFSPPALLGAERAPRLAPQSVVGVPTSNSGAHAALATTVLTAPQLALAVRALV